MIALTRFDEREVVVNADLILTIEATPDTMLTLMSGEKLRVREGVQDVVRRVIEYRRRIWPTVLQAIDGGR